MSRGGLELIFKLNNAGGSNGLTMWKDTSLAYNATVDNNPYKSPNHFVSPYLQATWDSAGDKFNTVYTSMLIGGREEAYVFRRTRFVLEELCVSIVPTHKHF